MKKLAIFLILVLIGIFSYYYLTRDNLYSILKDVDKSFNIDNYSIFGTHLNISGCIDESIQDDLSLVLKNNKNEIELKTEFNLESDKTCFKTSLNNNDGIYLDNLKLGKYLLLIKNNDIYYTLNNKTDYKNLEYYTITHNNSNNKINISFDKYKNNNYVEFDIKKEKLPNNVYDIVIDPGHGGKDTGSNSTLNKIIYYESNLTLKISLLLKSDLESLGLKVKLTRDSDTYIDPYGKGGRALLPNYYNSKYSFSIHLNSYETKMSYGGVEVYTPNNIDYTLPMLIADNISKVTSYSKKKIDKIKNGVYYTGFTKSNIKESKEELIKKGMKPFDIVEGSPYMYMIREVGGINTHAYIDGRNEYYGLNDYYNSNKTAEPYLIELGYINYINDLKKLVSNPELFSKAISKAINEYLSIS